MYLNNVCMYECMIVCVYICMNAFTIYECMYIYERV